MGPTRDGVYREAEIVDAIPKHGLPVKWRAPVHGGYAGPAVVGKRVFLMDYERTAGEMIESPGARPQQSGIERVLSLDTETGEEVWHSLSSSDAGYCPPSLVDAGGAEQLLIWHPEAVASVNSINGEPYWSEPLQPQGGMSIGYHLGEHGWWNKVTVFDIGARVPLVIWVPNSGGMSARTDAVVELLDLYPSLVELCHLKPPHELQGESLRPIVEDPSVTWQKPAYTEVVRSPVGMGYSVRFGDWRLTQWGQNGSGGLELYNVVKDKEGYYNHANDPEYVAILDQLYVSLKKGFPYIKRRSH